MTKLLIIFFTAYSCFKLCLGFDFSTHSMIEKSYNHETITRKLVPLPVTPPSSSKNLLVSNSANTTVFSALGSSILSSLSLTLFTEFGDRTFLLAALMSLKTNQWIVFIATCLALFIQTIFSAIVGQLLHLLPRASKTSIWSLPLDDYGAAILLFIFACIHMKHAIKDDILVESNDTVLPPQLQNSEQQQNSSFTSPECPYVSLKDNVGYLNKNELAETAPSSSGSCSKDNLVSFSETLSPDTVESYCTEDRNKTLTKQSKKTERAKNEYSFSCIFWTIFVAELGDKSMVSTIALSTAQNPYGVVVGSCLGHAIVTAVAVLSGGLLDGFISERILNSIGGLLFLIFGVLTVFEGLARQGFYISAISNLIYLF